MGSDPMNGHMYYVHSLFIICHNLFTVCPWGQAPSEGTFRGSSELHDNSEFIPFGRRFERFLHLLHRVDLADEWFHIHDS